MNGQRQMGEDRVSPTKEARATIRLDGDDCDQEPKAVRY